MTWQADAIALGWELWRVDAFAGAIARQNGEVLLVHRDVLALRTGRGALQCTLRATDIDCLASANRATEHLAEWIRPTDPFCQETDCKERAPCVIHNTQTARAMR